MDRISAIRNVEEALREYEAGETSLAETERAVLSVLRTYATTFEDDPRRAYRASGEGPIDGVVVVAESAATARERARTVAGTPDADVTVEPLGSGGAGPEGRSQDSPEP